MIWHKPRKENGAFWMHVKLSWTWIFRICIFVFLKENSTSHISHCSTGRQFVLHIAWWLLRRWPGCKCLLQEPEASHLSMVGAGKEQQGFKLGANPQLGSWHDSLKWAENNVLEISRIPALRWIWQRFILSLPFPKQSTFIYNNPALCLEAQRIKYIIVFLVSLSLCLLLKSPE